MYTSEIVKYWPEHSDWDLIFLYRKFSEEYWSAGWIGTPESMAKDFVRWLRGFTSQNGGDDPKGDHPALESLRKHDKPVPEPKATVTLVKV